MKNGFAVVKEGSRRPITESRHRTRAAAEKAYDAKASSYRDKNPGKQHPFSVRGLFGGLLGGE